MKRFLAILLACAVTASAQTYITVTAETNRVIRTNFSLVRSQVSDLSGATFAISNITALQAALDAKLSATGSAASLTNFPASLLTTNGSAAGLTNFPASLLATNGNAAGLTNFPSLLLRTNGDGSGLTNLPNANLSNAIGVLPLANGGSGATNQAGARTAFGLGSAATNDASAFQPANAALTNLAANNGGALTNLAYSNMVGLGTAATNNASAFQPASANLTNLAANDAAALTNFPAKLLRTNGNASALTNFPASLLRTNGDGGGLTNVQVDLNAVLPAYSNNALKVLAVASGETNVEWIAVSNTVTDASTLTNFPASILQTNSADGSFPVFLARTNADASGFTNFPTLNQNTTGTASNVTGVVAIANGGTAASDVTNARINLLPSYTGNEGKILAVNSNATDLVWQTDAGGSVDLTNATGVLAISNGGSGSTTALGALTNFTVLQDGGGLGGFSAVVIGVGANATNNSESAVAIGQNALVNNNDHGVAIGRGATTTGSTDGESTAIGFAAVVSNATGAIQLGEGTNSASGNNNTIQFRSGGTVNETEWGALANSTTIGRGVMQASNSLTAMSSLGVLLTSVGQPGSIVLGESATAGVAGSGNVAIGPDAKTQTTTASANSVALGRDATTTNTLTVAIGASARAAATSAAQIGAGTNTNSSTIQFLSAGTIDTNEWARIAALSTYPTTNISVVGTNNTNTLVFSNGILVEVQ